MADRRDVVSVDAADAERLPFYVGGVAAALLTVGLLQSVPDLPGFRPQLMLTSGASLFLATAGFLALR
jgi:hypothetical protein